MNGTFLLHVLQESYICLFYSNFSQCFHHCMLERFLLNQRLFIPRKGVYCNPQPSPLQVDGINRILNLNPNCLFGCSKYRVSLTPLTNILLDNLHTTGLWARNLELFDIMLASSETEQFWHFSRLVVPNVQRHSENNFFKLSKHNVPTILNIRGYSVVSYSFLFSQSHITAFLASVLVPLEPHERS